MSWWAIAGLLLGALVGLELTRRSKVLRQLRDEIAARSARRKPPTAGSWYLVGNIVEERLHGPGKEKRRGTKHFSPGARVYCMPAQWGDGYESIIVVGLSRSGRWITIVMKSDRITNWRAKQVYKPAVLKRLAEARDSRGGHWGSKEEIERVAVSLREWEAKHARSRAVSDVEAAGDSNEAE